MTLHKTLCLALLAAMACTSVQAQTRGLSLEQPKPGLNLTDPRISMDPSRPANGEPAPNRTSVDHTFGPQRVTVAVGYLCGLQPLSDRTPGPASTFGPIGTFLGGKLTYAFK